MSKFTTPVSPVSPVATSAVEAERIANAVAKRARREAKAFAEAQKTAGALAALSATPVAAALTVEAKTPFAVLVEASLAAAAKKEAEAEAAFTGLIEAARKNPRVQAKAKMVLADLQKEIDEAQYEAQEEDILTRGLGRRPTIRKESGGLQAGAK